MSKDEKKPEAKLDDFAPITQVRLVGTIQVPTPTSVFDCTIDRDKGSAKRAKKLEWHPMGVRVWLYDDSVFVVPADRIESVYQVPPTVKGRRL